MHSLDTHSPSVGDMFPLVSHSLHDAPLSSSCWDSDWAAGVVTVRQVQHLMRTWRALRGGYDLRLLGSSR